MRFHALKVKWHVLMARVVSTFSIVSSFSIVFFVCFSLAVFFVCFSLVVFCFVVRIFCLSVSFFHPCPFVFSLFVFLRPPCFNSPFFFSVFSLNSPPIKFLNFLKKVIKSKKKVFKNQTYKKIKFSRLKNKINIFIKIILYYFLINKLIKYTP